MRRFGSLTNFVAPLLLVSASSCVSLHSSRMDCTPGEMHSARIERLLAAAQDYERQGRYDAAMSVYDHILAQSPGNSVAQTRHLQLAQQGIKPKQRDLKNQLRQQIAPSSPEILMASQRANQKTKPTTGSSGTSAADSQYEIPTVSELLGALNTPSAQSSLIEQSSWEDLGGWVSKNEDGRSERQNLTLKTQSDQAYFQQSTAQSHSDLWRPASRTSKKLEPSQELKHLETTGGLHPISVIQTTSNDRSGSTPTHTLLTTSSDQSASAVFAVPLNMATTNLSQSEEVSAWESHRTRRTVAAAPPMQPVPLSALEFEPPVLVHDGWATPELTPISQPMSAELGSLIQDLQNADPVVRIQALQKIGELKKAGKPAHVEVFTLLEDPEAVVAIFAASTLREIADDSWSTVQTLERYLRHEDKQIVQLAAYYLGKIGPEAMDALSVLQEIRDEGEDLHNLYAAEAIAQIAPDDAASFAKLKFALTSEVEEVRWFSTLALCTVSKSREQEVVQSLTGMLQDKHPLVQAAACLSLGSLGQHSVGQISEIEKLTQSEFENVRSAAELSLRFIKSS